MMDNLKGSKDFAKFGFSLLANTLWLIWKKRNDFTFRNTSPNPTPIINKAKATMSESIEGLSNTQLEPSQSCLPM